MKQYGNASVYGVDGSVQIDGGTAIAAFTDSVDGEHKAQIEEFLDGNSEVIGFRKFDERLMADLTIIGKSSVSKAAAQSALAYPPIPCKITLSSFPEEAGETVKHNGDYIYLGGAKKTRVRGQAALKLTCFRPLTSSLTVAQLLTEIV
jgi:hypothetical protein